MASQLPPEVLGPIVQGFADALRVPMAYVIYNSVFAGILVPMLCALFYFSLPRTRVSPIFICAVAAVVLGILQGATVVGTTAWSLFHPLASAAVTIDVLNTLVVVLCILAVEVLLLCRVFVVVPPARTRMPVLVAVYTFPISNKIVRLAMLIVICLRYEQNARRHPLTGVDPTFDATQVHLYEAMWTITALDNAYASAIFLWKLHGSAFKRQDLGRVTSTFGSRVRTLFWLCGTNFVFPVPLYVAQLVLLRVAPSSPAYVVLSLVNNYVSIICAVFATVWSTGIARTTAMSEVDVSSIQFPSLATRSRARGTETTVSAIELARSRDSDHAGAGAAKRLDGLHVQVDWEQESAHER